jgi:hypothetical protein
VKKFLSIQTRKLKILLYIFTGILFSVLIGTFLITNPVLFRGEVLQYLGGSQTPTGIGDIFIPNSYQARPGQIGEIEIITTRAIPSVTGLSFDLRYNKQKATISETVNLGGTALQGFFMDINTDKAWGATIALASGNPVSVPANTVLLKLTIELGAEEQLPLNSSITFTPENIVFLDANLQPVPTMIGAGKITITGAAVTPTAMVINKVTPESFLATANQSLIITGNNFSDQIEVYLGARKIRVDAKTTTQIQATVLAGQLAPSVYELTIVNNQGESVSKSNAVVVAGATTAIEFVPDDFITTPDRVRPDGESVITLWVSVTDPLGVSDIDKVSANLTALGINQATALFIPSTIMPHTATAMKRMYYLETTVPVTLPTAAVPYQVPVTATNKSGATTQNVIGVYVTAESSGSVSPEILEVTSSPTTALNPGKKISFLLKGQDKDGIAGLKTEINLVSLGGAPTLLTPITTYENISAETDYTQTQWFILKDYQLNINVQPGTYTLPIRLWDKTGLEDNDEIIVEISDSNADAPRIIDSYSTPRDTLPRGKEADFYVNARDANGAADIQEVIIDLGEIGGGPVKMSVVEGSAGEATNEITPGGEGTGSSVSVFKYEQWYVAQNFLIKTNIKEGVYQLPIKVTDKSGLTGTDDLQVRISISEDKPEILEMYTNPLGDIIPGEKVNFFARIKDLDGINDIDQAIINLIKIGGGPVALRPIQFGAKTNEKTDNSIATGTAATETDLSIQNTIFITTEDVPASDNTFSTEAETSIQRTSNWYALIDYPIPLDTKPGEYVLPLTVTDKSGQTTEKNIKIKIITPQQSSDLIPKVIVERAYTTPRIGVNDATAPLSIYVFIQHSSVLEKVIINLGTIAHARGISQVFSRDPLLSSNESAVKTDEEFSLGHMSADLAAETCPTNSDVILCMLKTVNEGTAGTWYKIDNIVINKDTYPSDQPYLVSIIATDENGRIGQGDIPIKVGSGEEYSATQAASPPQVHLAVATSPTTVEVLFSKPLNPDSIKLGGDNFTITRFEDISKYLNIKKVSINASHTIITLETNSKMTAREAYAVAVDEGVTDSLGKAIAVGAGNKARFIGFEASSAPPNIRTVTAVSPETVEVVFTNPLQPSSIDLTFDQTQAVSVAPRQPIGHLYYAGENFVIREVEENTPLGIKAVRFGADAHVVLIETDTQQSKRTYLLSASEIDSFSGYTAKKGTLNRYFTGYVSMLKDAAVIRRSADFNGDGKVDFLDFTVFASFYGQTFGGEIDGVKVEAITNTAAPAGEKAQPQNASASGAPEPSLEVKPKPDELPPTSPPASGNTSAEEGKEEVNLENLFTD